MKKYLKTSFMTACLVLASNASQATVMTFNNTAPANSFNGWNTSGVGVTGSYLFGGHYTEGGMTLTASPTSRLATYSPTVSPLQYPSNNGTDFAGFDASSASTVTLSSASVFSLLNFNASTLVNAGTTVLTLTGHVSGGGTLSQTFNTLGNFQWSLFSLTNWNNLTSVDIASSNLTTGTGLDNITYNQSASVPEPSVFLLLGLGLAGMCWGRRDKLRA